MRILGRAIRNGSSMPQKTAKNGPEDPFFRCHATTPRIPSFGAAPGGVNFEKPGELHRYAKRIQERVVETRTMPLGNMTLMTEDERALLARWIAHGAKES